MSSGVHHTQTEDHAVVLPGRHPGHWDFLSSNVTKAAVWRLSKDDTVLVMVK